MKRILFLALCVMIAVTAMAQSNRTVETQKDRYGHVTGTATTTTDSRGNKKTVYKDRYGHITVGARRESVTMGRVPQPIRTPTATLPVPAPLSQPTTAPPQLIKTHTVTLPVPARQSRHTTVARRHTKTGMVIQ